MSIQKYLVQIEDMNNTLLMPLPTISSSSSSSSTNHQNQTQPLTTGRFENDLASFSALLASKKDLYGDTLKTNGLSGEWKRLGVSAYVHAHLLASIRGWVHGLVWNVFVRLDEELSRVGGGGVWDSVVISVSILLVKFDMVLFSSIT